MERPSAVNGVDMFHETGHRGCTPHKFGAMVISIDHAE